MLDAALRPVKERIFNPACLLVPKCVHPSHITLAAFVTGLAACHCAAVGRDHSSVLFWVLNRSFDCLDGGVARARNQSSDLGGFLDLLGDFITYSLIPIACASSQSLSLSEERHLWLAVAFVEMSFHINNFVLFYIAVIVEKQKASPQHKNKLNRDVKELTSVTMRPALIEGFESGIIFTAMLAYPAWTELLCWIMTVLVGVGIGQRVVAVSSLL